MGAVKALYEKMGEMGVRLGGITLAPGQHDPEVIAGQLLAALIEIEEGRSEPACLSQDG
jgi:hypothetical protein